MRHSVTISFSTKNKNGIILKLTFSPPNMNQSAVLWELLIFQDWTQSLFVVETQKGLQ